MSDGREALAALVGATCAMVRAIEEADTPALERALVERESAVERLKTQRGLGPDAAPLLTRIAELDARLLERARGALATLRGEIAELRRARSAVAQLPSRAGEARFVSRRV